MENRFLCYSGAALVSEFELEPIQTSRLAREFDRLSCQCSQRARSEFEDCFSGSGAADRLTIFHDD